MIRIKDIINEILSEAVFPMELYWLPKTGEAKRVNNHYAYASHLSGLRDDDEVYKWMYQHGWARIAIQDESIYVHTQYENPKIITLSKEQKEWLKMIRDVAYPAHKLSVENIYGRPIEI